MEIRWTQAARRHRIGRTHALHVMSTIEGRPITTDRGDQGLLFVGLDDRGLELEIVAAIVTPPEREPFLLIIHVMPTDLRKQP